MADRPRLPLIATSTNRDTTGDQDARLINGYVEKDALGELWVYKRPGYFPLAQAAAGTGRGIYDYIGNIFHIAGAKLYNNGIEKGTLTSGGDPFSFTETKYASPFFIKNNTNAYAYDGLNTVTAVVDADYPANTAYGAAYLDGTTYVMTTDGSILGSAIDDPTSWDPLNVIQAQNEAGTGVAIAKLLSLVVALKSHSIQFFYNAGNSTGSPLGRYDGPNIKVGCRNALTVQCEEDKLFWVSQSRAGGPGVMMLDKLSPTKISTNAIDRLLTNTNSFSIRSWLMRYQGHLLYGLKCNSPNATLVYDYNEKLWYTWTGTDDLAWPIVGCANIGSFVVGQHATDGATYTIADTNYTDDGAEFSWDLYTPNYDGGVRVRKTLHQMDFIGDRQPGSILQVRHNDFDYAADKWSAYRSVDLSQPRPFIRDEGTFYRRVYHFHQRRNAPLRLQAIELDIEPGYF
jgi:hypothetical protein